MIVVLEHVFFLGEDGDGRASTSLSFHFEHLAKMDIPFKRDDSLQLNGWTLFYVNTSIVVSAKSCTETKRRIID